MPSRALFSWWRKEDSSGLSDKKKPERKVYSKARDEYPTADFSHRRYVMEDIIYEKDETSGESGSSGGLEVADSPASYLPEIQTHFQRHATPLQYPEACVQQPKYVVEDELFLEDQDFPEAGPPSYAAARTSSVIELDSEEFEAARRNLLNDFDKISEAPEPEEERDSEATEKSVRIAAEALFEMVKDADFDGFKKLWDQHLKGTQEAPKLSAVHTTFLMLTTGLDCLNFIHICVLNNDMNLYQFVMGHLTPQWRRFMLHRRGGFLEGEAPLALAERDAKTDFVNVLWWDGLAALLDMKGEFERFFEPLTPDRRRQMMEDISSMSPSHSGGSSAEEDGCQEELQRRAEVDRELDTFEKSLESGSSSDELKLDRELDAFEKSLQSGSSSDESELDEKRVEFLKKILALKDQILESTRPPDEGGAAKQRTDLETGDILLETIQQDAWKAASEQEGVHALCLQSGFIQKHLSLLLPLLRDSLEQEALSEEDERLLWLTDNQSFKQLIQHTHQFFNAVSLESSVDFSDPHDPRVALAKKARTFAKTSLMKDGKLTAEAVNAWNAFYSCYQDSDKANQQYFSKSLSFMQTWQQLLIAFLTMCVVTIPLAAVCFLAIRANKQVVPDKKRQKDGAVEILKSKAWHEADGPTTQFQRLVGRAP